MKMNKKIYLLLATAAVFLMNSCKEKVVQVAAPLEVSVMHVLQQDVNIQSEFTGQTYGQADIQINPRVDGTILSLNFNEGSLVKKGQLLYTIDPLPFQTKVSEAEARVADAQAQLGKAKSDLDMIEPLAKINAVSQRELVAAKSAYEAAQAKIQAAQAGLQNSKTQLGYCRITAPISGLIGISKVRVGDYVTPGPGSVINTISDMTDIRVRFTISEQEFLRIFREVSSGSSALKGTGDSISLKLSDGIMYPYIGKLSFADREIDPTTGAITFEAAFPNPDKMLRPGQYVKVLIVTDIRKQAMVIPQRAVIEMQGIFQVYVVNDSNKVQLQIIQPGPSLANAYVVNEGLKPTDVIAFGGTQLLRNGSVITPKMVDWKPGQATK
jgi:membrane fusion protein (multidrug efflux system)